MKFSRFIRGRRILKGYYIPVNWKNALIAARPSLAEVIGEKKISEDARVREIFFTIFFFKSLHAREGFFQSNPSTYAKVYFRLIFVESRWNGINWETTSLFAGMLAFFYVCGCVRKNVYLFLHESPLLVTVLLYEEGRGHQDREEEENDRECITMSTRGKRAFSRPELLFTVMTGEPRK